MIKKLISALVSVIVLCGMLQVGAAPAATAFSTDFESGMPDAFTNSMFEIGEAGGNHYLLMKASAGGWVSGALDPSKYSYSNFTLSCDIRPVAFEDQTSAINFYLRGQTDEDTTDCYRFLIGYVDGPNASGGVLNVQFEEDREGKRYWDGYSPANVSKKLNTSTWNKITLVAEGNKFDFYIGNELVCSQTDPDNTFQSGSLRLAVWGMEVQLDNLKVEPTVNRPSGGSQGGGTSSGGNNSQQGGTTSGGSQGGGTSSGGNNSQQGGTTSGGGQDGTVSGGQSGTASGSSDTAGGSSSDTDTAADGSSSDTVSDTDKTGDEDHDADTSETTSSDKIMGVDKGIFIAAAAVIGVAVVGAAVLLILYKKGILFKK